MRLPFCCSALELVLSPRKLSESAQVGWCALLGSSGAPPHTPTTAIIVVLHPSPPLPPPFSSDSSSSPCFALHGPRLRRERSPKPSPRLRGSRRSRRGVCAVCRARGGRDGSAAHRLRRPMPPLGSSAVGTPPCPPRKSSRIDLLLRSTDGLIHPRFVFMKTLRSCVVLAACT